MISWETDMVKALARGTAEQKSVLLQFFSPECIGCRQMDEVTFADPDVINFMDHLVPLRLPIDSGSHTSEYRVSWTPTLIVLDYYGREHQRTVGFLPPDEIVGSLLLGMGKVNLDYGQFSEAVIQFNTLLNGCAACASAPEAVYLRGVARYKTSRAPEALKEIHKQLQAQYPASEWTKRAEPFTLL
ncbi:MAG TPA: hypothetical protein DCZ75_13575 [Geobacter sp.]|nr:hypothetical protein [Geobacter sp.]